MKYIFLLTLMFCSMRSNAQPADSLLLQHSVNHFLKNEVATVCYDDNLKEPNWDAVLHATKNKRIILLGEFSHGAGNLFALRNDLIKTVHQKNGADVILFESGMGELAFVDLNRANMSPEQMTGGFFGNWRTKEFEELMQFCKDSNISVAGFDVQRTANSFNRLLSAVAEKHTIDTALYAHLEKDYGLLQGELSNKKAIYHSLKQKTNELIASYQIIHQLLQKKMISQKEKDLLLTQQTIKNRITYLSYMLQFVQDGDFTKRFEARDAAMAENIIWLAEHLYPKKRILIIGHNYHIAKSNEHEQVMGNILSKKYGNQLYAIGFFAGSGTYTDNPGNLKQVLPADTASLDIKHIISQLKGSASFIHIPKQKKKAAAWLYENVKVNDSFTDLKSTNQLILGKLFDGMVLMKNVVPPQKIR